jgi:hypothetical protein
VHWLITRVTVARSVAFLIVSLGSSLAQEANAQPSSVVSRISLY